MANLKHVDSVVNRDFRNRINQLIDFVNAQGKSIQDLVAKGQLTPSQYATLIQYVNGLLKSGNVDKSDLTPEFKGEIERFNAQLAQTHYEATRKKTLNDVDEEFLDALVGGEGTSFNLLSIPRDYSVEPVKTTFMDVSYNLFNKDNIIRGRTVTTDGKEIEDDIYWLSDDLIPTEQGDVFSFSGTEAYRIITYRENGEFNSRSGTIGGKYTNNSSVVAFFRVSGRTDPNDVMVNRGRTLLPYEPYGTWLNSDFLNIDKLKFNAEDLKDDLLNELMGYVDVKNPYPPALHLEEIYQGSKHPLWLSEDGEIIYGRNGSTRLIMSTDEWENTSEILTAPQHINMVRELGDGELIFSCNRKDTESIHAKVYKTIGFDRNNPENTEFRQVLRSGSPLANINNSWGIDIYDNIVLLLEYGRQGVDGSNYAYLSTDYGENFIEIFDLKTEEVDGRPPHDEDGHVHTIA